MEQFKLVLYGVKVGKKKREGGCAIWVVVDHLTKSAFFLPLRMTGPVDKLAKLYVKEAVRLYGVPISIMCDCDLRFTSRLWPRV
jgi:hypothetical protein